MGISYHLTARRLPLGSCHLPGLEEDVLCGTLKVAENPERAKSRRIPLYTLVVPALNLQPRSDALVHLDGGPGMPATQAAHFYAQDYQAYRDKRDIVLLDQRGTGQSHPLNASLHGSMHAAQAFFEEMYPPEGVTASRKALERQADLTQYSTSRSVEDLEQVREWLGYPKLSLFGFSYGTRLALAYLRAYPENVRCAVLVGAAPPLMNLPSSLPVDAQRALDQLLEACAEDPAAGAAFPNLRRELEELLARLRQAPARLKLPSAEGEVEVEVKAEILMEAVRRRLYSPLTARALPKAIYGMARGDFSALLGWAADSAREGGAALAEGLYLSVTCAEDVPFIDQPMAEQANSATLFGNYRVRQQARACALWPSAPLPPGFRDPVTSDVPVLVVSGNADPITPPRWGQAVATHLANSTHVVVQNMAHFPSGVMGLSHPEIVDEMIVHFIDHLSLEGFDLARLEAMQPPAFDV